MCRIAGIVSSSRDHNKDTIINMTNSMWRGGPDSGETVKLHSVALGHRRLSIIDLSDAANQPFESEWGVIVFNGEIYNYLELRKNLLEIGVTFNTQSDTEVLLKCFEIYGKEAVHRLVGMFAFAIYVKDLRETWIFRDRFGVKPLYYMSVDGEFAFASEVKAFHHHPCFDKEINRGCIADYISRGYISGDQTIFKSVKKLLPGHYLTIHESADYLIKPYWNARTVIPSEWSKNSDVVSLGKRLLAKSVSYRTIADVPIGLFLSGGTDSGLVGSLLNEVYESKVYSFTMSFDNAEYDEAKKARQIATEYNFDHTEIRVKKEDVLEAYCHLFDAYDEPFGDASAIPTLILSKYTSRKVKVVLSGDGGDELFSGYSRTEFVHKYGRIIKVPLIVRKMIRICISRYTMLILAWIFSRIYKREVSQLRDKIFKFRDLFESNSVHELFDSLTRHTDSNSLLKIIKNSEIETPKNKSQAMSLQELSFLEIENYLVDDVLVKVDRASMYYGLEAREPLLDESLLKFSLALADEEKIDNKFGGKAILKKILQNNMLGKSLDNSKYGFSVPISQWLTEYFNQDLVELCGDETFFETMGLRRPFIEKEINKILNDKSTKLSPQVIWHVLALYGWFKRWIK